MRLVTGMAEFCAADMPLWHPISNSGYHIREAGSTAAQELAFTLADGFTYVEWALERGLDVDDFAPRLSFFFNAHLDFFEEIAKYRAARRIWATLMRDKYGAKDPRSWLMRFHTQTAGVSLTAQQPEVNIVRTALEAMAAVLGGTQSLHTNSFDEAALARLKDDAAHEDRNLMHPIVDAARAYVTMGEMCDAFREVWGTLRETPVFYLSRRSRRPCRCPRGPGRSCTRRRSSRRR